jgi:hypothetical protein
MDSCIATTEPRDADPGGVPDVFVLNLFAEGYLAFGKAFTPVRHQAQMAEDLANLPQFLCEPGDVVLLGKRPSEPFLNALEQAGFLAPQFVELVNGRIDPSTNLRGRRLGSLRPWAWGPDSVGLLEPLFGNVAGGAEAAGYFNDAIARLYSKAWSADFLRKVLARRRAKEEGSTEPAAGDWVCSDQEVGVAVDTLEDALEAVAAIRRRGHHRVTVKEAYGLAGHNALRLWEPELLPAQRQWLSRAVMNRRQVVVEPWLEREVDFSIQLEMEPGGLKLCGYTGLITDLKGQFVANWAEPGYERHAPEKVACFFEGRPDVSEPVEHLYGEVLPLLEVELRRAGFSGPVSIDAFVYRTSQGDCRLKPVVEINPRYTMGRLTVEVMKHVSPGSCGVFRLVSRAEARAEGFEDFSGYAQGLAGRFPFQLERSAGESARGHGVKIRRGALCLNDPARAQVCLATFEVRDRDEEKAKG